MTDEAVEEEFDEVVAKPEVSVTGFIRGLLVLGVEYTGEFVEGFVDGIGVVTVVLVVFQLGVVSGVGRIVTLHL